MNQVVRWPPSWTTLLLIPALLIGFTVHEIGHALVAFMLGDTSQLERNRLSLNPLRHVSWLGMAAFLLVGLGWAKPVVADQGRFRMKNQSLGMFLVSIAGPTANLLAAALALAAMTTTVTVVWVLGGTSPMDVLLYMMAQEVSLDTQGFVVALTYYVMFVNLMLAFFNLLPIPPLDGFRAIMSLYDAVRQPPRAPAVPAITPSPAGEGIGEEPEKGPAQIHFDIGLEYQRAGQMDEAIARYRQAIVHDEFYGVAYYNQGLAYLEKGRLPLATSSFRAALDTTTDVGLRIQSDLRLRELAAADDNGEGYTGDIPAPLESEIEFERTSDVAAPMDPTLARRAWLRILAGAVFAILVALSIWMTTTVLTLQEMM